MTPRRLTPPPGGQKTISPAPGGGSNGSGTSVRVDLRDQRRDRERARRRLLVFRLSLGLAVAAVALVVVWVFLFSSIFALRSGDVEINGAQSGLESEILPVASAYEGVPLPRVPTDGIAAELATQPLIAEVEVERSWPHGLAISITEREAVALVRTEGGFLVVGRDGVATGETAQPVDGLPMIAVSATEADRAQSQAAEAILVLESLPTAVLDQLKEVTVNGRVVALSLTDGSEVVWGDAEDSDLKGQVLALLVQQRPAQVYDLRDPRQPVTR